jgi:S-adenosylmethionine synthetase
MFGYATDETPELMPAPLQFSHNILRRLAEARRSGARPELEPDAKSQVTMEYENGRPVRVLKILVSTQHKEGLSPQEIRQAIEPDVRAVFPDGLVTDDTEWLVNPTGNFVIGGPDGDAGLTGRKIIVDTYGGAAPHGGGAFSGKDPTKVDRSAAYVGRGSRPALHHPGGLRDRREPTAELLRQPARHRADRPGQARAGAARHGGRPDPACHPRAPGPEQADL